MRQACEGTRDGTLSLPPPHCPLATPEPLPTFQRANLRPGDYALVSIHDTSGITLRGSAVARTTLGEYSQAFGLGGERAKAVAMAATAATAARRAVAEGGLGAATAAAELPAGKRAFV